ncbi:unnamed protein product [Acanthoscelides obtectus]|nr:unnamed protein product [Acanthoscelides obtectus]CAK1658210.1 WD repeat, SAM and U-box domain-containing protein 1 [Acanthoscelides obtectus]
MSIDAGSHKILQTLNGHKSDVTCCDFYTNFTLVTGSSDKTVRVWDWQPGSGFVERPNSPLKGHKYQVTCVKISPQGSMLVSSSVDGTTVLWNTHSCAKLFTMSQIEGNPVRVCRFSPDSAILVTGGDNGAVCVWDLVHRSLIKTLFEHEGTTQSLAFTPDSQYLVTACSLEVMKIWYVQDLIDTTTDTCTAIGRVDNAHDMGVFCVDISNRVTFDEENPLIRRYKLATSGNTNEIKIWEITATSTLKHKTNIAHQVTVQLSDTYSGHTSSLTCIKYSHNGRYLVSSGLDKLVKIWDQSGNCIATLEGHRRYVSCATISRDMSLIASGSNDKLIIIWDLSGNLTLDSELRHSHNSVSGESGLHESALAQNLDSSANEVVVLEKNDEVADGAVNSCHFHGKDLLAIGSGDKLIRMFKVKEGNNLIDELSISPIEGHTYAINHVEFSTSGQYLASCSLDGCTTIWNTTTGEKHISLPENGMSVKVCRFSPNEEMVVTAGDDEKGMIWDLASKDKIGTLEGHLDAVPSACFSPDNLLVVTVSSNSDFRVWCVDDLKCLYVKEDAHDLGIQCCDMSQNLEPIPNTITDTQSCLLATCGNDSLVKLWRLTIPKQDDELQFADIEVKLWRSLQGHGGNVLCVRFSPAVSEFVCSTATDRQARIWSVYSATCLYVLDHDSIVTACSFNADCSLLATGCQDKTLWMWKLPEQLVFQTVVANKIHCRTKQVMDWSNADVVKWLEEIKMQDLVKMVQNTKLDGQKLLTLSEEEICSGLELNEESAERISKELRWLKKSERHMERSSTTDIPHEFLCPITHEIMREPVTCSDGFTYEKRAIAEWFMSGKYTSPMTNEHLANTDYTHNLELRNAIHEFLDHSECDEES